ncbi:MAG: diaminopropionate ammonia-lyase [Sphaerochaetaceae bacterium]|nr:diaminopropionate ammonia-lyase [Sphaerochaetaceae bacterium]
MHHDYEYIIHNDGNVKKKDQRLAKELFSIEHARDARKFHRQIPGYKMTPLSSLPLLANMLGLGGIYIKDEAQRLTLNSFKVMGGSYAVYNFIKKYLGAEDKDLSFEYLTSDECHEKLKDVTFCSATDGNHGRGLAWASMVLGLKCHIYVHKDTSKPRIEAIRKYGATITIVDGNYDDAVRRAAEDAKKNGWYVVSDTSWDGYTEIPTWIMQGYTSILLEAQEQFAGMGITRPTHVIVQAGVGALAASVVGFYTALFPDDPPVFIVVEPDRAACIYESIKVGDGKPHSVKGELETIMAGLACGDPSPIAFDILNDNADAFIKCRDYVAARGMRILSCPISGDPFMISGESGAVPLGILYSILSEKDNKELVEKLKLDSNSLVFMINTEGNTDPIDFRRIIWDGQDQVPKEYRTRR